jgi:hypothetical protein
MSQDCHILACCLPLAAGENLSKSVSTRFCRASSFEDRDSSRSEKAPKHELLNLFL